MSEEEYKNKNIKLAIFYFFILISVQVIGIFLIIQFFLSDLIIILIIALLIGVVAPIVLAKLLILAFRER